MNIVSSGLLGVTTIVCSALLVISIYPGALDKLLFWGVLAAIVSIPTIGLVGVIFLIVFMRRGVLKRLKLPWRTIVAMTTIVFISTLLLTFYVPRRLAFMASRSAFESFLPQASQLHNQPIALNRKLVFYHVDTYARDARGGVYFRVYSTGAGLGPDLMSYGFVYQPNLKGSPFGAAGYQLFPLSQDWYWFQASNDWF